MDMERYKRQITFHGMGEAAQKKLLDSRVTIIGMGALGSVIANNLCRSGVGFMRIIDRDVVERTNLQRQILFDENDADEELPKVEASFNHLHKINSEIEIEPVAIDINPSNIERYIEDVDLVIDGTDNFETRFLINEACHKHNKNWIYGGVVASGGATMDILFGDGPCLRCLMPDMPEPGSYETCTTVGVINSITGIIGSYEANEALKILTGADDEVSKKYLAIDIWDNSIDQISVSKDPDCPVCGKGEYELLNKPASSYSTSLCGHDSWQIVPDGQFKLNLEDIGARLDKLGEVNVSKFVLSFGDGKVRFKLFPDGRAIIDNVPDVTAAKNIYSEYIGI